MCIRDRPKGPSENSAFCTTILAADAAAKIVVQNALFSLGPFGRKKLSDLVMPWCTYTEPEINERLRAWNAEVAPAIQTDHVTVRRMLVDYGHLERTADGGAYRVGFPARALAFDLEVEDLDVRATIAAYLAQPRRRQRPDTRR